MSLICVLVVSIKTHITFYHMEKLSTLGSEEAVDYVGPRKARMCLWDFVSI